MSENGEEKLLAMARHIAKSLSNDTNMTDQIHQILSDFDERFTIENLSEKDAEPVTRACAALDHSTETLRYRFSHFVGFSTDAAAFLAAIDDLNAVVAEWTPLAADESVAASLMHAQNMLQRAMSRLEDEFRSLMERGAESFDFTQLDRNGESRENLPKEEEEEEEEDQMRNIEEGNQQTPVINYDMVIDTLPSETIDNLHEIAKRMVAGGYGKECSYVYDSCRRKFMKESLSRLGLRKLTIQDVLKLPWKDLEDEIERWIKASNVALTTLFPSERRLYDRVFLGVPSSSSAADLSFMEVCRESVFQLLNFADAVAMGTRSPKLLFRVLDMFETMDDLIPKFKSMFCDVFLKEEASMTWKRLGKAITWIFMELENLIRDSAKTEVSDGGVHPITCDVMNYLRAACRSRETLEHVFKEYGHPLKEYPEFDDKVPSSSSMPVQVNLIMELLESSLEAKSKIYKDPALGDVFLMNNVRYIVQEAKDGELGTLLGNDWIKKHHAKVREYHLEYQRKSLNGMLEILKPDNESMPPGVVAKSMKEKLMSFNTYFENICRIQSSWFVFDEQLREEISIFHETFLVPAYRNFIGRFQSSEHIKHADKYIKYETEKIQTMLKDLFQGNKESTGRRK
ncbi:exocyst complex component EXO70B1-like [Lotus japonicus]|uniref:exocyst complex component EXO70B1-like n=1 Tax=Lotus japonicus TaxID=34305 RepID=UPI0025887B58|nr:exocyst complex component EXO70B1-like [Lotus japonicus]